MPKAARPKYDYPFVTKAQILAAQQADDARVLSDLVTIHSFQTTDEQGQKVTKYKNRTGFMSSHAVNGSKLAEKHLAGESLGPDELALARKIAASYGRQLAAHERERAVSSNPAMAVLQGIFIKAS
jgi:hypothetical protein